MNGANTPAAIVWMRSCFRSSWRATKKITANLASSPGWNVKGPSLSQRCAPSTRTPTPGTKTAARSSTVKPSAG